MPYVKKEQRKHLDVIVKSALKIYKDSGRLYWDYILAKFVERFIDPGYNTYKNFLAEVAESAFEMERRFRINAAHIIVTNGDMFVPNDHAFKELDTFVANLNGLRIDGDLNYVLFAFGVRMGDGDKGDYILQLKQAVVWIRKTMLAPYEDKKIKENGDVK